MGYEGDKLAPMIERLDVASKRAGHNMAERMVERGRENIRMNTPVATFHLRNTYKRTPVRHQQLSSLGYTSIRWSAWVWQGTVYTEVEYAPHVEYGTGLWGPKRRKYKIQPKKPGGVLRFTPYQRMPSGAVILDVEGAPARGKPVMVRFVMHPGSPGQHMFRIGAELTEMQFAELSAEPLRLWKAEVESRLTIRTKLPQTVYL